MIKRALILLLVAACGGGGGTGDDGDDTTGGDAGGGVDPTATTPKIGGCNILPADNIFNTKIDALPPLHESDDYIDLIGRGGRIHLDLGTQTDQTSDDFYGIPYNLVHGNSMTWAQVAYTTPDTDFDWDPKPESDCADASKGLVSPCDHGTAYLPFPNSAVVEGGLSTAADHQPAADHHLLAIDVDNCRLWEGYHVYKPSAGWQIFGSATFDLSSNALRPQDWTSADAAGFPILPLLLKPEEAESGEIKHALRFTIPSGSIRATYSWPARHHTGNHTELDHPQMGQLFRLKASFEIPASYSKQSKAILQAMKTYGMYLADGGSAWYVSGAPGAWDTDTILDEVQSVTGDSFEAVDIHSILDKAGFDGDSARVP
ncbi:MAG TPA: hypothetical protein VGM90_02770 [Kofleriaceae bacterium]